jgi:outer membrane PBP1 activator LpoA protein
MDKVMKIIGSVIILLLAGCSSTSIPLFSQGTQTTHSTPYTTQTSLWEGNTLSIWEKLQSFSSARLAAFSTNDPTKKAWIQLALINKRDGRNTVQLVHALQAWQNANPSHPANQLIPNQNILSQLATETLPQHLAILLPENGPYASSGQVVREGIMNSYYAQGGKQTIKFYNTASADISYVYQQALNDGADFVIGPLTKNDVQVLKNRGSFGTTTLALNYTSGYLPERFYEFGLMPEDEITQITNKAAQAGLSRALIIAPNNAWGTRITSSFQSQWQTRGGRIVDRLMYLPRTNFSVDLARFFRVSDDINQKLSREKNNKTFLEQQGRHDFDVIFLFAEPQNARIIVPLIRYYHTSNVAIYASSSVYSGQLNPAKDLDLNGVIICDIPWRKNAPQSGKDIRLYAVGQDAYLLSQNLARLIQLPYFSIYGKTGALTLDSQHQVHRRIPCAPIQNGAL